jgi:hypothetical protein
MRVIHLRVWDRSSFGVELSAYDARSFRLALRKAMFEYRGHFLPPPGEPMSYKRPIPEPDLQIKNPENGEWISAAYGGSSGRHVYFLPTNIVELTSHAEEYWKRVLSALDRIYWFNDTFGGSKARKLLGTGAPRKRHLRIVREHDASDEA